MNSLIGKKFRMEDGTEVMVSLQVKDTLSKEG